MGEGWRPLFGFGVVAAAAMVGCAVLRHKLHLLSAEAERARSGVQRLQATAHRQQVARQDAQDARQAAVAFAQLMASHHYKSADEHVAAVIACSAGDFKEDYVKSATELRDAVVDNWAWAQGVAVGSAIEPYVDGPLAVVLLFVDQSVVNMAVPAGELKRYRVRLTMEKQADRWLVSNVQLV